MDWVTSIGLVAAFCTTTAFLPQVIKSWKTKHVKDISLMYFVLVTFGIFMWFIYGLIIKDFPVIIANGISVLLAGSILYLKLKDVFKKHKIEL